MKSLLLMGLGLVLPCGLTGCAKDLSKHEALTKAMLAELDVLVDSLETVKDQETARAVADKINKTCDRVEEMTKAYQELPKLTKEEEQQVQKLVEPEVIRVTDRMSDVTEKAEPNAGEEPMFVESMKRLRSLK